MPKNYLLQALALAQKHEGFCAPNPAVGAVIVNQGAVVATGWHEGPGSDHAEVMALKKAGARATGSIVYVSLEPCCHQGRTPPCVAALVQANISKLVYAYRDPNPVVSGQGAQQLLAAGIACEHVVVEEVNQFYQPYLHWTKTGLPWVTVKLALSLDGKIAGENGKPVAITGPQLKKFTYQQRLRSDALLTTTKTILADDPRFDVRLQDKIIAKPLYLLGDKTPLLAGAQIHSTVKKITRLDPQSSLSQVFTQIGAQGIHRVWVEAGSQLFSTLIAGQHANQAYVYIAPKFLGDSAHAYSGHIANLSEHARSLRWQQFGEDVCLIVDFFD